MPKYVIFSHTWQKDEEVTFQEFKGNLNTQKVGWDKIKRFCKLAREAKYEWSSGSRKAKLPRTGRPGGPGGSFLCFLELVYSSQASVKMVQRIKIVAGDKFMLRVSRKVEMGSMVLC